ncbi:MAG TPA: carboxymuconolactone decarboxylase family protein [Casimicrobiaceae bacterium]|nr:carboxymuconolactone decarboxylase family protein [Casimicrobiaceae bacterium]
MSDGAESFPLTQAQIASGDWNPLWDTLKEWDPEFVEAYIAFRLAPRKKGPLSPVMRELILIAVNACTTHMYAAGVRRHIENALNLGATREQILEAIQLTTLVGIHSCNLAVPILKEALDKRQASART